MMRLLPAVVLGVAASGGAAQAELVPKTMGAWVATELGGQRYEKAFRTPQIGDLHTKFADLPTECEVLVKVMASSVNPCDLHTAATLGPTVAGSDIAGVVVELSTTGCTGRLKVGDQVWADIGAVTKTAGGKSTKELGGYAEYAVALETQLGTKPSLLGWEEAGSLPKVALTSYKALAWYAGGPWSNKPTVLVLGGSGGTGTAGIQLAKAMGAGMVITTTSADNFAYCKGLGADWLIDYKTTDWWTKGVIADQSVDVVYDCVGQVREKKSRIGHMPLLPSQIYTSSNSLSRLSGRAGRPTTPWARSSRAVCHCQTQRQQPPINDEW